jgi:multiple sugar transport system ATP-binding protein
MKDGILQQAAGPMQLYERPANLFVAGFIGSPPMNFFRGTLAPEGGTLFFRGQTGDGAATPGRITLRVEESSTARLQGYIARELILGVRPESIRPIIRSDGAPLDQPIQAVVEVVEPLGSETWLHLSSGSQTFVARVPATERVRVNDRLAVVFEMRAAHFFDADTGTAVV